MNFSAFCGNIGLQTKKKCIWKSRESSFSDDRGFLYLYDAFCEVGDAVPQKRADDAVDVEIFVLLHGADGGLRLGAGRVRIPCPTDAVFGYDSP